MSVAIPPVAVAPAAVQSVLARAGLGQVNHDELVRYVHAFLLVKQLRADLTARLTNLPTPQKTLLENQVRRQVDGILSHEDLSRARFNALSTAVEQDLLLRQRVQQIIIEEQIGT